MSTRDQLKFKGVHVNLRCRHQASKHIAIVNLCLNTCCFVPQVQDIVAWVGESSYLRPGYWVGVDHRLRQVCACAEPAARQNSCMRTHTLHKAGRSDERSNDLVCNRAALWVAWR